ncbi:hypothetical protein YK48G_26650 [Lentilactobacillus fungorum]|uniref:Integral membrane protein n=1 Tax=Lentilactobacillus fungorum TaxID=2201250 RepID=A0ABQ3W385_9LACO|nr:hypothetical protein [Lentilactobacillus fungorum]GHP15240.1 hypothetical protein YK48G_26650 [Lentilactobacillus fungorum]
MNRQNVIRATIIVVLAAILIPLVHNFITHRPILNQFPYGLLGIIALAYVSSFINLKPGYFYTGYFILYLFVFRLVGGYYNWTSWILLTLVATLVSWVTNLLRRAFSQPTRK